MNSIYKQLIEKFPLSQNNGARIIQSKIDRMNTHPSESLGQEIEALSGIPFDWLDADYGEERELTTNN